MPRTFVDLSIYLENDVISDPPAFGTWSFLWQRKAAVPRPTS